MIEAKSDDKKIFDVIGDSIIRKESFRILVKGAKARLFKKIYELDIEYSKTKKLFVYLKIFFLQLTDLSVLRICSLVNVMAKPDYEVEISDLENGDVLIIGIPKEGPTKA
jgi:hypothetical protein